MLKTSEYLGREPRELELLEESIVKLFQETFAIDLKTCTQDEWSEKISIKGGALKQWQSLIKVNEVKEIENTRKGSLLFIALSVLLLIGIGLLPKSPVSIAVLEPTATAVALPASTPTVKATLTATAP